MLFISFKLYRSNKEKKELLERENTRIHNQIEMIAKAIDEKGNSTLDITQYNLTERQVEIIQLIKQGKSNKEIANQLFISENTVKYHLKIIYGILDIEHRTKFL